MSVPRVQTVPTVPGLDHLGLRLEEDSDPTQGIMLTGFGLDFIERSMKEMDRAIDDLVLFGTVRT